MNKGWECPRCGKVWAPWVQSCTCSNENNSNYNFTIHTTPATVPGYQFDYDKEIPEWQKHVTCTCKDYEVTSKYSDCLNSVCANH